MWHISIGRCCEIKGRVAWFACFACFPCYQTGRFNCKTKAFWWKQFFNADNLLPTLNHEVLLTSQLVCDLLTLDPSYLVDGHTTSGSWWPSCSPGITQNSFSYLGRMKTELAQQCKEIRRSDGVTFMGNRTRVARMLTQWFTNWGIERFTEHGKWRHVYIYWIRSNDNFRIY